MLSNSGLTPGDWRRSQRTTGNDYRELRRTLKERTISEDYQGLDDEIILCEIIAQCTAAVRTRRDLDSGALVPARARIVERWGTRFSDNRLHRSQRRRFTG